MEVMAATKAAVKKHIETLNLYIKIYIQMDKFRWIDMTLFVEHIATAATCHTLTSTRPLHGDFHGQHAKGHKLTYC